MARSALDHSKIVLGAIVPNRRDLLDIALTHLDESHFPDLEYKNIFILLERFIETTRGVMSRQALEDILARQGADKGKVEKYKSIYEALENSVIDDSEFRWSVEQLKELSAEKSTAEAITSGMEILTRGVKSKKGDELFGHKDARIHVMEKFADIDRTLAKQESPEGDARTEAADIWEEFNSPKAGAGIRFGVPELDAKVQGLHPGELDLLVGYTSSGKSTLAAAQLPWSAAIEQGKNVIILTTETLRPTVRRRLLCRHSRLPIFGLEKGINSNDLKRGVDFFPKSQLEALRAVVDDFTNNPNYGKLVIVQVPRNATISTAESKVNRYQREFNVDLVVMDSINLFRSDRRFSSSREELASMLKDCKQFATTFDDGRGVPLVSPWQTNRESWKEAQNAGYYNSSALAETSEASASSDTVITILEPMNVEDREVDLKLQLVKHRDGSKANNIDVRVDYATSYFFSQPRVENNIESMLAGNALFGGM